MPRQRRSVSPDKHAAQWVHRIHTKRFHGWLTQDSSSCSRQGQSGVDEVSHAPFSKLNLPPPRTYAPSGFLLDHIPVMVVLSRFPKLSDSKFHSHICTVRSAVRPCCEEKSLLLWKKINTNLLNYSWRRRGACWEAKFSALNEVLDAFSRFASLYNIHHHRSWLIIGTRKNVNNGDLLVWTYPPMTWHCLDIVSLNSHSTARSFLSCRFKQDCPGLSHQQDEQHNLKIATEHCFW